MRVLVVEDEVDLAGALKRALQEDGLACDVAERGDDALARIAAWPYDLIILDLMLPGTDGLAILERLRRNQKTPVLVLTARDAVADRVRLLDMGADDYMTKPFALEELLARARALVRRAAGTAASLLKVGDVTIDPVRREVSRDGRLVSLSPREFAIVHYLSLQRGRVISQPVLYEHVYDENDSALSNVIEVHISQIRKKLGADFVRTRRGEGYVVAD